MRVLLEVMRLFHHMVGITTPDKENERKVFFLWIAVIFGIIVISVVFMFFIVQVVFG